MKIKRDLSLISIALLILLSTQFCFVKITTQSIPYSWCLQVYNSTPSKGRLCAFEFHGKRFVKYLEGIAGDEVENRSGDIYINGKFVGRCSKSSNLSPIESTKIPDGYVFVAGSHEKSFDSRYVEFGLIKTSDLRGRVWPIARI